MSSLEVKVEMEEVCWNAMARGGNRPGEHEVQSGWEEEGLCLTWEDLWVTASNGKGSSRVILAGLTGYARPGEVLAIMGPSGCGKSTLLNALAGNTRTAYLLVFTPSLQLKNRWWFGW